MERDSYHILAKESEAQLKEKGSKFIGYSYHYKSEELFKAQIQALKETHHSARHWCWAYRSEMESLKEKWSDDGEPSNTAGKPIFNAMRSSEIYSTAIVVVRYFGGTLLGVRGLIDAYGGAAKLVLEESDFAVRELKTQFKISFGYELMNLVEQAIHQNKLEVTERKFEISCEMIVDCARSKKSEIESLLKKIYGLGVELYDNVKA